MRYFVIIGILLSGLGSGCAIDGNSPAGDETEQANDLDGDVAASAATERSTGDELSLGELSPGPILAASCGRVTLDFCHDPRFPSQVTATCHPAQRCSCAAEIATCQSLVRQFCGSNVQNIVVSNCDRP